MRKYDILFFDLDNTLWDFDYVEQVSLTKFFKSKGVIEEELENYISRYRKMNKVLWEKLEKKEITREELVNTRFSSFFKTYGFEYDGKELSNEYEQIIKNQGDCIEGSYELLNKLSSLGYKLYALTNGISNIQRSRLAVSKFTKFFDKVYISQEIGYSKPSVEFFEYVYKDLSLNTKENLLLIGDSLSADIKGANNFLIDSVWYNPKRLKNTSDAIPTYVVNNYEELFLILDK